MKVFKVRFSQDTVFVNCLFKGIWDEDNWFEVIWRQTFR